MGGTTHYELDSTNQSLIKKMAYRYSFREILWRHFLNEDFLFSYMFRFVSSRQKSASTGCIFLPCHSFVILNSKLLPQFYKQTQFYIILQSLLFMSIHLLLRLHTTEKILRIILKRHHENFQVSLHQFAQLRMSIAGFLLKKVKSTYIHIQ